MRPSALLVTLALALAPIPSAAGQSPPDSTLKDLSIEDLGDLDITTVSKHSETVRDAAAAVSVITSEDLRRAGITELAEAMRLAAGIAVTRFNGETWGVSARGFNISTANKMLVMIDGRSVYTPLFSGVFWGVQDVVLEDVERIEVVRGPGGTLWGANAVNGVINIITKRASDTQGTLLTTSAGSQVGQQIVRYGATIGNDTAYRAYAKYSYLGSQLFATGASARDPHRHGQAGFRVDWTPPSRTAFTLQGDAYTGASGLFDRPDIQQAGGNLLARLSHLRADGSQFQVQLYYDGTYRDVPRQFSEHRDTYDVDSQVHFRRGRHDVISGIGYRYSRGRAPRSAVLFFEPETKANHILNLFAEDSIAFVPNFAVLTLGSKFEHNVYTGFKLQPTARFRISPGPNHTFWAAVSRAVRIPTRFDTDLRFTGTTPVVVLQGNPDFQSENVLATEVGYRARVNSRTAVDVAAFVNAYDDLRTQEPSAGGIPVVLGNRMEATTAGIEIGVQFQPVRQWQLQGSYIGIHEDFRLKADSRDPTGGAGEHNDPRHRVAFRSYLDLPRSFELDATFRALGALPNPAVAAYAELTLRVGWRPRELVELALIGDNLLHGRHGESAPSGTLQEQFIRRATARATWRF